MTYTVSSGTLNLTLLLLLKELSYSWQKTKHESTSCVCTAFQTHLTRKPTSISGVSTRSNFQPATNSTDSSPGMNRHSRATWNMDRALLADKRQSKFYSTAIVILWSCTCPCPLAWTSQNPSVVAESLLISPRMNSWLSLPSRTMTQFFHGLPTTTDAKLCC